MGELAAFQRQQVLSLPRQVQGANPIGKWSFLFSCRSALNCALLLAALILYIKFLFEDVTQREHFPGYLSTRISLYNVVAAAPSTSIVNGIGVHRGIPAAAAPFPMSPLAESLSPDSVLPKGKLNIFIAVFIMAFEHQRRSIIRSANRVQSSYYADITVRFVLGGFHLPKWLATENATFGDLIVLQCRENLNAGKTYHFFSAMPTVAATSGLKFDYVMKTDDDSYVRFENLGKHLWLLPRTELYYGYTLPCGNPRAPRFHFRAGAGYILSWDLVLWIGTSPIPSNNSIGLEDKLVGEWFEEGGVAKNQPMDRGFLFHDHPKQGGPCSQNFTSESIVVHKLKAEERYLEVIAFYAKNNRPR